MRDSEAARNPSIARLERTYHVAMATILSPTPRSNLNGAARINVIKEEPFSDSSHIEDREDPDSSDGSIAFLPRPPLPEAITKRYSVGQLMELLDSRVLDLDPDYQREVVWPKNRMTGLVDSLFDNCYIPPVIFNERGPLPARAMVCVDGKQRISSIRAFLEGGIPCHDRTNRLWYYCSPTRKTTINSRILPDAVRQSFLRKEIVCVVTAGLNGDQEEDLFSRVQLGIPLSLAEKMHATSGLWQNLGKLFETDFQLVVERGFAHWSFFNAML